MELTDNDRQRIADKAKETGQEGGYKNVPYEEAAFRLGYILGAEYATIYERQKEGERCPSLPECYAESKKLDALEAERSEVIKENETLKEWKQSEIRLWRPIIEYMQSNGHLFGMKLGESISDKVLEVLKLNSLKTK